MVGPRQRPYNLSKKQVQWVEEIIRSMSLEEKIEQLFMNMAANEEEYRPENIKKILDTYHPGAIRYYSASKERLWEMAENLQDASRIPFLIASNCEMGGNGGVNEGATLASGVATAAMDSKDAVYEMASISAEENAAIGCNRSFAPVADLACNWGNTVAQFWAFNNKPDDVMWYAATSFKGMRTQNFAICMKHFPGGDTEENDQHLIIGTSDISVEERNESLGRVYKALIDEGRIIIVVGHTTLPAYSKKLCPDIRNEDIRPVTSALELITGLPKRQLSFNDLVVTDASHVTGMFGSSVSRREQVSGAVATGCDMFLFFNDRDENFRYMMEGYKNGIIIQERSNDTFHRILGVKAALNLRVHKREGTLIPSRENLWVVGHKEYHQTAVVLADRHIALVKDRRSYLPMTTEKHRRLRLVCIGSETTVIARTKFESNDQEIIGDIVNQLEFRGFGVDAVVGQKEGKMEEFKARYDAVLPVLNVQGFAQFSAMCIKWDEPAKQLRYMPELSIFVLSLSLTNSLIDVSVVRCYVNTYVPSHEAFEAAPSKVMGKSKFMGRLNDNTFCNRWEARFQREEGTEK